MKVMHLGVELISPPLNTYKKETLLKLLWTLIFTLSALFKVPLFNDQNDQMMVPSNCE